MSKNISFENNKRQVPWAGCSVEEITSTLVFITHQGVCNIKCTVNDTNGPIDFDNKDGQNFQNGNKQFKVNGEWHK